MEGNFEERYEKQKRKWIKVSIEELIEKKKWRRKK